MTTLLTTEPRFQSAVSACVAALRRLADYELDPPMARRLEALSERKEFLTAEEHDELMGLVEFARRRTVEKLEAAVALRQLKEIIPDMVGDE